MLPATATALMVVVGVAAFLYPFWLPSEALPTEAHAFWAGEGAPPDGGGEVRIPQTPAALARRLGGYAFFRGADDCEGVIRRIYKNASVSGLDIYLSETD